MAKIVWKLPGCGFAPNKDCEGLEAASKSTTSERAIPSWDRLGEEGEPSWRLGNHSLDPTPLQRDVPSCKGREHGNTSSSPRAFGYF